MLMLSTAARSNNPFSELIVSAWIRFIAILLYFEARSLDPVMPCTTVEWLKTT